MPERASQPCITGQHRSCHYPPCPCSCHVAARTRQEAKRLRAAWREYDRAQAALAGIVQCPSVDEATHAACQLLEGHEGRHRHRVMGTRAVLVW